MNLPYVGIVGIDRTGDILVSLQEEHCPTREAILAAGLNLHAAVLVPHSPNQQRIHDRMENAEPGDYVFIRDGTYRRHPAHQRHHTTGYLISTRREGILSDEEWEATKHEWEGRERPTERITYLQYGPNPGDIVRWEDADRPRAIPINLDDDWTER